jgi:hypothetical protein
MTLKEKFTTMVLDKDIVDWEKVCGQIADDYAIEFASFIDKKYYQHKYDNNKYAESEEDFTYGKTYSIKQLLEIFKKEKGL